MITSIMFILDLNRQFSKKKKTCRGGGGPFPHKKTPEKGNQKKKKDLQMVSSPFNNKKILEQVISNFN
jgi:hypothetical protein